jgi:hypothetical protein
MSRVPPDALESHIAMPRRRCAVPTSTELRSSTSQGRATSMEPRPWTGRRTAKRGAPTMTIAAKGSAAPVVGPVRVLTSAAEKGRLA